MTQKADAVPKCL